MEHAHRQRMPVAGGNDRVGVPEDAGRQAVSRSQHANRPRAAFLHHLEIEAGREHVLAPGQDDDCLVGLGLVERRVDLAQHLGRQRIALAVVDANRGNAVLKVVLNKIHGFLEHRTYQEEKPEDGKRDAQRCCDNRQCDDRACSHQCESQNGAEKAPDKLEHKGDQPPDGVKGPQQ
jgi:hypothetical protein